MTTGSGSLSTAFSAFSTTAVTTSLAGSCFSPAGGSNGSRGSGPVGTPSYVSVRLQADHLLAVRRSFTRRRNQEGCLERTGERERGVEPLGRIVRERAPKHRAESRQVATGNFRQRVRGLVAGGGTAPPPQHLVNHRGQTKHIRSTIPRGSDRPLRRCKRAPDLRQHTHTFDGSRNPEAGEPGLVRRQQDVAWVQHAVFNVDRRSGVERARHARGDAQRIGGRRRSASERDIERLGGDVVLGEIRAHALDAGGHRRDHSRMRHRRGDQPLEFGNELMDAPGRQVESEEFNGHETIVVRIERPKHGPQCTGANLMENPEWTEGLRRRSTRSVRVQSKLLREGG